jgi:hypothetical protein
VHLVRVYVRVFFVFRSPSRGFTPDDESTPPQVSSLIYFSVYFICKLSTALHGARSLT